MTVAKNDRLCDSALRALQGYVSVGMRMDVVVLVERGRLCRPWQTRFALSRGCGVLGGRAGGLAGLCDKSILVYKSHEKFPMRKRSAELNSRECTAETRLLANRQQIFSLLPSLAICAHHSREHRHMLSECPRRLHINRLYSHEYDPTQPFACREEQTKLSKLSTNTPRK